MYWILGGLMYIFGAVVIIRWLDGRWDPRRPAVRKLFAAHRREFRARERACEKYINKRIEESRWRAF